MSTYINQLTNEISILNAPSASASSSSSSSLSSHMLPETEQTNQRLSNPKLWIMNNIMNNSSTNLNNNGLFSSSCTPSPMNPQQFIIEHQQQQILQHRRNSASATPIENSLPPNYTLLKNTTPMTMIGNNPQMYAYNIRDNTPSSSNFITNNIQLPLSSSSYILTNYDCTNDNNIQVQLPSQQSLNTMYISNYMQSNVNDNQQNIQQPQHLLSGSNSTSSLKQMQETLNENTNAPIMKPIFSYKDIVQNENTEQSQILSPNDNIQQQLMMGMANMNMNNIQYQNTNLANMKSCSITPVPVHIPNNMSALNNMSVMNMHMMNNNQYQPMLMNNMMNMSMSSLLSNDNNVISNTSTSPKIAQLSANLNPNSFPLNPRCAKFFVIKSFGEDDVHKSIKYSLWCSTGRGNRKLDEAFADSERLVALTGNDSRNPFIGCPIYLFFSVNRSGCFCGMAQMISSYDENRHFSSWVQDDKWQGSFMVKWIFVKDIPNKDLKDITLPNNDNRPVTFSRDTQEIPFAQGIQLLQRFVEYKPKTNILQDFQYYDDREKDMYNIMIMNAMPMGTDNSASSAAYFNSNGMHGRYQHSSQQPKQFQRDSGYHPTSSSSYPSNNEYLMYGHARNDRYGNGNQYRNKVPYERYGNSNGRYYNNRGKGRKGRKRNNHYYHKHNEKYVNKSQRQRRHKSTKSEDNENTGSYQILKRQRDNVNNVASVGNDVGKE